MMRYQAPGVNKIIKISLLIAILSSTAEIAYADCPYSTNFTDNKDGTLTDPENENLVWKACNEGFEWKNGQCEGSSLEADWYNSMRIAKQSKYNGYSDWRLPTINEFNKIACKMVSANGAFSDSSNAGLSRILVHAARPIGYTNRFGTFRTISVYVSDKNSAVHPNMDHVMIARTSDFQSSNYTTDKRVMYSNSIDLNGKPSGEFFGAQGDVRLVRKGSPENYSLFLDLFKNKANPELVRRVAAENQAKKQQDEAEKQSKADENKFQSALNHKNPQVMYLAAGAYQRNGETGRASAIYERIISKFQDSNWAVKASDQLSAKQSEAAARETINRASSDASRRAHRQCKIEMDSCYSQGGNNCYRNCDSLF